MSGSMLGYLPKQGEHCQMEAESNQMLLTTISLSQGEEK